MAMKLYPESNIQSIASAIRSKNGSSSTYTVMNMADAILNLGGDTSTFWGIVTRSISGEYTNSVVTSLGSYALYSCRYLTDVSFSNCTTVGSSAFAYCYSLSSVGLSKCTSLYQNAFYICSNLRSMNLPSCSYIGSSAFRGCSSMHTVKTSALKSIYAYAFYGCSKLTGLWLYGSSLCSLGTNVFIGSPMSNSTLTGSFGSIYVPSSLLASYKAATNWTAYSARMVAIESIG